MIIDYLDKVVLPLFHKHEAKIDTLASSAQVTEHSTDSTLRGHNFENE